MDWPGEFQDIAVYKSLADSPADVALDPPILYATRSFDAFELPDEPEACRKQRARAADLIALLAAVLAIALVLQVVLAAMRWLFSAVGFDVGMLAM